MAAIDARVASESGRTDGGIAVADSFVESKHKHRKRSLGSVSMPKRKVADLADDTACTKKAKVASATDVEVGSDTSRGVTADSNASITGAADAMSTSAQEKKDTKGKGKAVDIGSEGKDDQEMEDEAEEEEEEGEEEEGGEEERGGNAAEPSTSSSASAHKLRKLAPPRPYPTVPTSVSATGPRSAHTEGKNYICVTRKTPLGAYLRRCKDVVLKDGYVFDEVADCTCIDICI